jgi:hypothetical protein
MPPAWQVSGWTTKSKVLCGEKRYVPAAQGTAAIRVCLVYLRNTAGTYYHQGTVEVTYRQGQPGGSDLFSATSMAVRGDTAKATTLYDCPRTQWGDGGALWCFSKTVTLATKGVRLYAKGILIDAAGGRYEVWSPSITTV